MQTCHKLGKNNDSVSWERKKRILLEGYLSKRRKSTALYLPVSNSNNLAKNDFHQKFKANDPTIPDISDGSVFFSILRYSAIYG